jgi:hypothetical protein
LYAGDTDSKEISSDQQLIIERNKQPYMKRYLNTTMLKLGYEISGEMAESIKLYIQTGLRVQPVQIKKIKLEFNC